MGGKFDLHLHTNASDGMLEPEEVVAKAAEAGLLCIAITDHDTTKGVRRAILEGRRLGLAVIAGAEFTAQWSGELHLLGYGMDINAPAYGAFLAEQQRRRAERNSRMLANIERLGMKLPSEYTPEGVSGEYGRKHMALGLEKAGYVQSVAQAFEFYLSMGRPAYAARQKFTAQELIEAIRTCGGHAVLAHPGRMDVTGEGLTQLVMELAALGLEGIEAYYPTHSPQEAQFYGELAQKASLVCTYGSDWHGFGKAGLAAGFEDFDIPDDTYRWLENLLIEAGGLE